MKALEVYLGLLQRHPLKTRMVTAAIVGALGNYLAQRLSGRKLDWVRVARFATLQALFTPLHAQWYPANARIAASVATSPKLQVLVRVVLDQTLYSPLINFAAIAVLQLLEGASVTLAVAHARRNWLQTQLRSWCVWPFAQLINYSVVPQDLQIFFANLVGLVWSILLSRLLAPNPPTTPRKNSTRSAKN